MGWGYPSTRRFHIHYLPVLLIFLILFAGANMTNDTAPANETGFVDVDEFLNITNETHSNETTEEFLDLDDFLNLTEPEDQNETLGVPPLPEQNETPENETIEEVPEPPVEENQTDEFIDVDEFFNATENETKEDEFIEVEEFLNITGNGTLSNETNEFIDIDDYLNLSSQENGSLQTNNLPVQNDTNLSLQEKQSSPESKNYSFVLLDSGGRQTGAELRITKGLDGFSPQKAALNITSFGIPAGEYDIEIVPLPPPNDSKEGIIPVPVSKVLLKDVQIDSKSVPNLRMQGLSPSATPFGKNAKQAFAIDPTDFNFTEGEIRMVSRGTELYKCAEWNYADETCEGKWVKAMDLVPGEEFVILIGPDDPAYAVYNATYGAPECSNYTSPCIAGPALLRSRDSLGTPEPNQPNTIDSCTDGTAGSYLSDEYVQNITISSLTAPLDAFNEGDLVRVSARVYCWDTGASDNINLVYASNVDAPSWTVVNYTDPCPGGGYRTLSWTFTLDNIIGSHAVRVINQYNGNTGTTCGTGAYDDNDDVIFQVNGTPPSVNLVSPAEGETIYEGIGQFIFNVTEASSCTLYIDGTQDQPTTISADADTNYVFNASLLSGAHTWQVLCGAISSEVRNVTQSPKKIVFEDAFTSSGGFSPDATNSAPWQRGNATQVLGCHLDSSCWGTGLSANYNAAGPYDDFLTKSVSMNLSDYANVSFVFYHYRYFENAATLYDAGVVDINNGTGWVRLTPEGGYPGTVNNGFSNPLGGQQAYGYHGTGWELEEFNLSSYSGQENVTLRFYFAVDSSVNDRGWFVDDVKVFGDPQVDYGIISVWDTSDTQTVIPGQNNTFYANYSYFNGTPIPGPSGTCNITTNATYQMSYNSALGAYEFNQSFPSATSGNFTVTCQLNSSFIPDSKTGDYVITGVSLTNLTCWEYQDPVTPAYLGGYNQIFLFCNYSYLNDTPVNSDGICTWQDETYIDYYFFGQETFNQRDVSFFGERQILYSFDGVWAELNASKGQGKVACYNETQGSMVVHMCLEYLDTSQDVNNNLNNSNESANCFPVGTMTCGQFSWLAGVPKGTFSWVSMDLNMTDFYNTWNAIGSPYLVDMQFTYECPNCTYSLYTTPYNVSDYGADLVALYRFDEFADNGTANISVDAAGNMNLTKFGSVGISPGQVNKSLNFSSAIGYIYAPDVTGFDVLSHVTAEAYIKLEYDSPKERAILSKWAYSPVSECGSAMDQSCLDQRSTRMYLDKEGHLNVQFSHNGKNSGTVTLRDPAKFPVGEWVHAGFVFNGTTIRLYRNSVIVAETEDFSGYKIHDGTAPWIVGADDAGNHDFAEGMLIDELRVIKRGLEDWEFVSHADADLWLIKSQSIPETYHTFISEELSGNKRNFTRSSNDYGENLVKLSVLGQALNMSFNSTTGLYSGHRAIPYGFHPGTYTINYSCSKTAAEPQSVLSDWQVYSSAPNCSIDGYLPSIPLGSYQYVNWSVNSNTPPLVAYYNVTHSDGHVYSYYNTQLTNGSTYVNHAPGIAEITCYVENENSSYSSTKEFNITGPEHCFYASGEGATYVLASDLNNTKEDAACITVDADNVTIDCAGHSIAGNGTGSGILVNGHNKTILKNCSITSYGYGIRWISSNHGEIRNNTLSNNTNGILIDPSYNNTIIQNQLFNNSVNGLYLEDSHNNTIRNNTAHSNSNAGILLNFSTQNTLTGNEVYNNTNEGIFLLLSDYNLVNDTYSHDGLARGIRLWESSYNNLTNNRMFNDIPGLQLRNGSNHNRVISNTACNSITYGFRVFLDSTDNIFINNTLCNNTRAGIQVESGSHNNSFYGDDSYNNSDGANITDSDLLYFYGSNFSNNSKHGIYFSNSHHLAINGSHINGNGDDGISGWNSDYANISSSIAIENTGDEIFLIYSNWSTISYNLLGESIDPYLVTDDFYNHTLYGQVGGPASDSIDIPYNHHGFIFDNNGSNTYAGVRCDGCTNMSITQNQFDYVVFGVGSSNMSGSRISFNNVSSGSSAGLYLIVNVKNNNFSNNTLANCSHHGVYLDSGPAYGCSNNTFTNNTIYNNTQDGVYVGTSEYHSFYYNNVSNNTRYGISLRWGNHTTILHNTVSGNGGDGIESVNSSHLNVSYNTADYNGDDSIDLYVGENNWVERNTINYPSRDGINLPNNTNSTALFNNITDPGQSGVRCDYCYNVSILDNNITQATAAIGSAAMEGCIIENNILMSSSEGLYCINECNNNNFTNNTVGNHNYGVYLWKTTGNIFRENKVYGSTTAGIYIWNATQTSLHDNTVYDNPYGVYIRNTAPVPITYNMTNTMFLPASGIYENYTNLSVYDSVGTATTYTINWTYNSSSLPANTISFREEFVNISTVLGSPLLEQVTWHWTDSETSAYTESKFEIWKYNSSGWILLNNTPNTAADTLSLYNMNPASDYGILQNNEPPYVENVTLNSTYGTNLTTENLTVYYDSYDPTGFPVKNITNWYLNDTSLEVLNMPFEGGSNSTFTRDYSGYGNNGTVSGAQWNSSGGHDGFGAYSFNGSYSIDCGDTPSLNITEAFTIEAWLKPSSFVSEGIIIAKPHSSFSGPFVTYGLGYSNSNNYDIALSNGSTQVNCPTSSNTVDTTQYQHVVATWDGSTATVYIDGEANSTCTFAPFDLNAVNRPLYLGYYPFGGDGYNYEGLMDDVKIYGRALSAEQVRSHYLNGADTIVSQETEPGETWQACITPNNMVLDGQQNCSNNLTINNASCRDDDGDGANYSYSPGACAGQIEDCDDTDKYIVPPFNGLRLIDQDQVYTLCSGVYHINASNDPAIRIDNYNITLNCNGTTMIGNGRGTLIDGYYSEMEVKNCIISNYTECMDFGWGDGGLIHNNNLSTCTYGLNLESFKNGEAYENIILQSEHGITLSRANNSLIYNNTIESQLMGYYASNQYLDYSGEVFDDNANLTFFVPSNIFSLGGEPCYVTADGDSLFACSAFDGETNLSVILNDLSPFSFGYNTTIIMDGEFNSCSDADNWWDSQLGSHPPCYAACVLYTANGYGNNYTLNESCYNATVNVSAGLTYPPYVNYGPVNSYGIEVERSDGNLIYNNIFNATYPATDDNNGTLYDYFSSLSPITLNGADYLGNPPMYNYTRFLYNIYDGEVGWSNEINKDNFIFTDDAIEGTNSFGMFVAYFPGDGRNETVYFDTSEFSWSSCSDVENDLYVDLGAGDCKAFCGNILTANGEEQNYTFDNSCMNSTFNVTAGFTYPPYLNYEGYAVGFNDWNITQQTGPNIIGGLDIGGNFYSSYTGVDTNGDGIGETPYPIPEGGAIDQLPLTNQRGGGYVSLFAVPFNISNFTFASSTYGEYIVAEFNTTEPTNFFILSSFNVEKLTAAGTNEIWTMIKVNGTIVDEERIRTVSGIGDVGSTALQPINFTLPAGNHNITVEFRRTGTGIISVYNVEFTLGKFLSNADNPVRYQVLPADYQHTAVGYEPAFNWTITKTVPSRTFLAAKGAHQSTAAEWISYHFENLDNGDESPTWERYLSSSSDVGSMLGVFVSNCTCSANWSIQSKNYLAGRTTIVNMTIMDFDLMDNQSKEINSFFTTNASTNWSNPVLINSNWNKLANYTIELKNGTGLFLSFTATAQQPLPTTQVISYKVNVSNSSCEGFVDRSLTGTLDAGNMMMFKICDNLTTGQNYTAELWTKAAPGRTFNEYDESFVGFEIGEFPINVTQLESGQCQIITSSGTYGLTGNAVGAPYDASPRVGTVCVKIASSDVVLDCNGFNISNNGTAGTTRAILLNGSLTNVTVRNCPGLSGYSYGLEAYQSNESVFRNITAFNNSLYGIYLATSHNNSIHDSLFYNNSIAGGLSTSGTRNLYQNNSFSNNTNYGFYLQSSSNYNNFTNNTFNNNSLYGLHLFLSHNNSVSGSIAAENAVYGIYLVQSTQNNLSNNTVHGNSGHGFVLTSSGNNRLLNNTAYGHVDSGTASGFSVQGSEYNVFIGNSAHNNSQHGFTFSSSNYTTLHNNSAYNNSFDGIQLLLNSTGNNLTENILFDNLQNGIWLDVRSSFNLLENNTAYDNALSGIQLTDLSNNNILTNNTAYNNAKGFTLTIGFNLALPVSNNTLRNNRAYNNTNGYLLELNASLNLLEDNVAYKNDDGFSLSSAYNNTFINSSSYNNTYSGFTLSGGDGNSFTNLTSQNNTDDGFYATDSSNITIDPSKLKNNGANGVNLNNCEDVLLEDVVVNDNNGHGLHMVHVERARILTSEFCNNHQYGIRLHHSLDTNISNSLICNNSEYGLRSDDSNNTRSFSNNITNNTITGVYLDSDSRSNSFNDTFVCFNGFDFSNSSALSAGTLDYCDSYANWTENGHPGCTFKCTDIWQYFYGDVNGSLLLAPNQVDIFYSWLWDGDSGAVYVISGNATIDWSSLIALGRNTSQQNSTNDFTELDTLLGISAEPDNVNDTYSYDGSNPNLAMNVSIFEHFVPYVPLANSTFTPGDSFFTGIVWDSSQDTSGNGQFNIADNEDVVFSSGIDGTAAYDYEIMVPATLATYKGGNTVEFWVELD